MILSHSRTNLARVVHPLLSVFFVGRDFADRISADRLCARPLLPFPLTRYTPQSMPPLAQLENVSKLFGTFAALRQISVNFEVGRCYVLLGENGAGKSTLLRVLAGLLRPSFGTVRVFGQDRPEEQRGRIGYMSHAPMMYDD